MRLNASCRYLPSVHEEQLGFVVARVLSPDVALHLRAIKTFTDIYGKHHKAGEEWLVTSETSPSHICDVFEVEVCDCWLWSFYTCDGDHVESNSLESTFLLTH